MVHFYFVLLFLCGIYGVVSLDNGVARYPPQVWTTKFAFGTKMSESSILQTAQALSQQKFQDAGYTYIMIDDGWSLPRRDPKTGNLRANPHLFPSGLYSLVLQLKTLGFKAGITIGAGVKTCLGLPGSYEHEYQDIAWLSKQGFEFVEVDACFLDYTMASMYRSNMTTPATPFRISQFVEGKPLIGAFELGAGGQIMEEDPFALIQSALTNTGQDILYSIQPVDAGCLESNLLFYKDYVNMVSAGCTSNLAIRPDPQIEDSFDSLLAMLNATQSQEPSSDGPFTYVGPGYFYDYGLLTVGGNQAPIEYVSQVSMFVMLAAPLKFSATFDPKSPASNSFLTQLLTAPAVLNISADPAATPGYRTSYDPEGAQIWVRPLADGEWAVALLNSGLQNQDITISWDVMGLKQSTCATVRNAWQNADMGRFQGSFTTLVKSHDTTLLRVSPTSSSHCVAPFGFSP